jgi:tetratricopeptide (TPR) repeat protein
MGLEPSFLRGNRSDDLHWADSASLDLLLHLVRHTRGGRVLLLGIYRDVGLPRRHTLRTVLGDTIREQLVERIRLLPFERDETGALARDIAGERLSDALVDLIHSRTEGNPFFIRQVLEPLKDRGHSESIPLDALSTVNDVPESVRIVILRRVNSLSEGAQEVLCEASALGQTFGFVELQAMGDREEAQVEQALDEVIAAGVLRDISDDTYAFDHALTQGAIYADLSSRRKRRLHRAAGSALEHLPERNRAGRSAEIAWHFLQGEYPERALPWSMMAGDAAAALFAHTDAETHYRTAAELARRLVDERGEAEALDRLAEVLYRSGRSVQALEPLQRAAETYERLGDRERYLGLVARLGEAYQFGGRAVEGLDRVLPVVKPLEERGLTDPPSASMADLYAALCPLYLAVGRFQDALETAETAVSLAESTGNLRALCTTEISRGLALGVANRGAEQRRAFEHASEIAESLTDEWLLALAVFHLGVSYLSVDDVEQAELHMLRALEISDRAALEAWATFVRLSLSDLYVVHGRWQEARHEAERAEAGSRSLGPRPGGSYPLITLGRILLLQGEHEAGIGCLDEALAMATRFEYVPGITRAQETLAWQEVRDGRPRDAVARLDALLAGFPAYRHIGNPSIFAWALLDDGNEERTAEMLAAARQKALAAASRAGHPEVLLQSARLATRQERWVDAVRDLWEGVAIAQEISLPYDEALLLHEYGRMHAAKGELDQARMRLAEALTIFRRLGASVDVERVEQTLSALARLRWISHRLWTGPSFVAPKSVSS